MITVDKALQTSLNYLVQLFGDAVKSSVLLEEVDYNKLSECWEVTYSFPARIKNNFAALQEISGVMAREYKIIKIEANTGEFLGAKARNF